jgi:hypothetical protein
MRPTADELRGIIGGVHEMAAWYEDDGTEVLVPLAHGRFVLVDGQVVSCLFKTNADGSTSIQALYGRYEIEDGAFSYGYDFGTLVTEAVDGAVEITDVAPTQMMRYEATPESDSILLRNADDRAFRVTEGVMEFIEHGHLRRIWRRVVARD